MKLYFIIFSWVRLVLYVVELKKLVIKWMWGPRLVPSPDILVIRWEASQIHELREEYFALAQFIQDRRIFYCGSYLEHLCDLMERIVSELDQCYSGLFQYLLDNNLEHVWPNLNIFLN